MSLLTLKQRIDSGQDRTVKLIYTVKRHAEEFTVEVTAVDKGDGKRILCLPTQTNCAQGCRFCHTTELRGRVAVKNLLHEEMRDLVRVSNVEMGWMGGQIPLLVSFMGMGEPLANTDEIVRAMLSLEYWYDEQSIRFAFATMVPARHLADLTRFAEVVQEYRLPVKMHLSLHATQSGVRKQLMPTASSITEALGALHQWQDFTGNPVEIHYTPIAGVNDSVTDLFRLRRMLADRPVPVKFLNYNPPPGDDRRSPDDNWLNFMRGELERHGIPTEWYDSPGADIQAACGMFATDVYEATKFVPLREVALAR